MGMPQQQLEGTPLAHKLRTLCYLCGFIHVALSFFLMFDGNSNDTFGGIMELITATFLFCGASSFNFCCVLCYMFLLLFSAVQ